MPLVLGLGTLGSVLYSNDVVLLQSKVINTSDC
jgi:hypothetical protein